MENYPFQPLFISGAPRSGTTVAHALICSSPRVNSYVGECSYFSQLVRSYLRGLETFPIHTQYYFRGQSEFREINRRLLHTVLNSHWDHLGKPEMLALKDPDMLPILPAVAELVREAKFVIVYRDPRDVIASRVQVQKRRHPQGEFADPANIASLAEEYVNGYCAIEHVAAAEAHRFYFLQYEQLVVQKWAGLLDFLQVGELDASAIWQRSAVDQGHVAADPWYSRLYFKPVSSDAVGSYKKTLDSNAIHAVEKICSPTTEMLKRLAAARRG